MTLGRISLTTCGRTKHKLRSSIAFGPPQTQKRATAKSGPRKGGIIPESFIDYNKKLLCTHGWATKPRGDGQRSGQPPTQYWLWSHDVSYTVPISRFRYLANTYYEP
ncbi:hypothetical protein PHMEG_00037087 [Phytophthora megakarya]|uniref:Uncharacterized protein n=1 Tax=Phytophthora megakarya TaxID=4795 RepID=A0A225UKP7_9STRA|nr:hypothetical protein PHMEG_00037087 [Phytophthora megakarya]